jgi:hypothetical protein
MVTRSLAPLKSMSETKPPRPVISAPNGHLYNLESEQDPVADLGRFGGDPSTDWVSVDDLSTQEAQTPEGQPLRQSTGHSTGGHVGYLSRGTTSQHNASAVAAGTPDRVVDSWQP